MSHFDRNELDEMLRVAMTNAPWTDEQLLDLLQKEWRLFAFVPRQTPELCLAAVKGARLQHWVC